MKLYGFDKNPEDIYVLKNENSKAFRTTFGKITRRLQKDPDTNYLILYVIAGHGMNQNGQQVIVVNEFDKPKGFYKLFAIEANIRIIAYYNQNSCQYAFFACCREVYDGKIHSEGKAKGTLTVPKPIETPKEESKAITTGPNIVEE